MWANGKCHSILNVEFTCESPLAFVAILVKNRAPFHCLLQKLSVLALIDFIMIIGTELSAAGDGTLCRFDVPAVLRDALYRSAGSSVCLVLISWCLSA